MKASALNQQPSAVSKDEFRATFHANPLGSAIIRKLTIDMMNKAAIGLASPPSCSTQRDNFSA